MRRVTLIHALLLAVLLCCEWPGGGEAAAQVVPNPELSRESLLDDLDVAALAADLKLTDEQHVEVMIVVDEFVQWRRQVAKETEETLSDIVKRQEYWREKMMDKETGRLDPAAFNEYRAAQQEWKEHRARTVELADEILQRHGAAVASVKTHLTQSQQARLDEVLRDIRRRRTLDWRPHFAAERADLIHLFLETDILSVEEKSTLAPALARYAEDLDLALRQRNENTRREPVAVLADVEMSPVQRRLLDEGSSAPDFQARFAEMEAERAARHIARRRPIIAAHRRIRDLNLAYFAQYTSNLAPEARDRLERAFHRMAYPDDRIEAPLEAGEFMAEALALDSLSPEQRSAVDALRDEQWWPRRRAIETALRRITDEYSERWEDNARGELVSGLIEQRGKLYDDRRKLGREIIDRVAELLTDEQRQAVTIPQR